MSVYDGSGYLSGVSVNHAKLISQFTDDLPVSPGSGAYTSSPINMASSSYATARTVTVPVLADELCVFITQMTISCGTALDAGAVRHRVAGVDLNNFSLIQDIPQGSTNGQQMTLVNLSLNSDLTPGNVAFDLRWARVAGSGTIYSQHQYLYVLRLEAESLMQTFTGSVDANLPERVNMADLTAAVKTAVGFEVPIQGEFHPETKTFQRFSWEYEADNDQNATISAAITGYQLPDHQDDDFAAVEKAQAAVTDLPAQIAALTARVTALEAKVK